jgi:very-short-patch-repair endonuclease
MATPNPAKRDEAPAPNPPRHDAHALDAYCAQVVSLSALRHFVHVNGGGQKAVAWLAGRQLSVVRTPQLHAAGLDRGAIGHRLKDGSLHRRHRGVYLVGSPIAPPGAIELAALFACGDGALISHRSAAVLWGLLPRRPGPVDVTVVAGNRRQRAGINVYRVEQLDRRDRGATHGIAVTAPARTLADFAADAEDDELEAALSESRALKLIKERDVVAALDRAGNRRGVARLRRLLRLENDSGYTQSRAERVMRRLLRGAGLPQPLCNRWVHGCRVDFVWLEQRLVVQVDGFQFHGHRGAFERDRKTDQILIAAGYTVIRFTWLQLKHEPLRVAAVIAAALTVGRTPG